MKIVLATGGFDPVHSGHIQYLSSAAALGDMLVVGINSDEWLTKKKGKPFMPWHERAAIVKNLKPVNYILDFDDSDGTAIAAIKKVKETWPNTEIIFANGGDRTNENTPEQSCGFEGVIFAFGVGGFYKKNSSSAILENWSLVK